MKLVWDESAWADYLWWQGQDRKTLKRINTLTSSAFRPGRLGLRNEPIHCSQQAARRLMPEEVSRSRLDVRPGARDALGTLNSGAGWHRAQLAYEHAERDRDRRQRRLELG